MKNVSFTLLCCCTQFLASAQWTQLNSGTIKTLKDVFFVNIDTGFAVGHAGSNNTGIVIKTTDGGATWTSVDYGFNKNVEGVYFVNDQVGFICGKGFISKTTDQGNTWTPVLNDGEQEGIQFLNEDIGYILDNENKRFLKTSDGGQAWTEILYSSERVFNFCFSAEDTAMITDRYEGDGYTIRVTHDGTVSWAESLLGGYYSNTLSCVTHIEDQTWIAIRSAPTLFACITTDDGQTWNEYIMSDVPTESSLSFPYKSLTFPTPTDGWAVGSSYIINSTDGGYSWVVNEDTPDSLYKVFFPSPQVGYTVGSAGLIMKYEPTIPTILHNPESQLLISPNPFQNHLFISLAEPDHDVTIRLYDMSGRLIALPIIFENNGLKLNTENLLSGIYMLYIMNHTTGATLQGKFVKSE